MPNFSGYFVSIGLCYFIGSAECGKLGIDSSSAERDVTEVESANHDAHPENADTGGSGGREGWGE